MLGVRKSVVLPYARVPLESRHGDDIGVDCVAEETNGKIMRLVFGTPLAMAVC